MTAHGNSVSREERCFVGEVAGAYRHVARDMAASWGDVME